MLYPDASRGNTSPYEPRGRIGTDGRYELTTENRRGAPPGWYRVAVVVVEPDERKAKAKAAPPFDPRYASPKTSDLSLLVTAGAVAGAYDIELRRPGKR